MMKFRDTQPALYLGAKIVPQDISGMLGLPYVGNIYYVDATNGSDTANDGMAQNTAFKTLTKAYASLTDNAHDCVVIVPGGTGTGTGTVEAAAITWSKNLTHVIGACAANGVSQRARVTWAVTGITPLTVSGQGCTFSNVMFYNSDSTSYILCNITGSRNLFDNVHFNNVGGCTNANWRALKLTGGSENRFIDCLIGQDTTNVTAANANIELASAATRNEFIDCRINCLASGSGTGHLFVKAASAADVDRYVLFKGCIFHNPAARSAGSTMTVGMSIHAAVGGDILVHDSVFYGVTDISDDFTAVMVAPTNASTAAIVGTYAGIGLNAA